jgi:hypothetical protein
MFTAQTPTYSQALTLVSALRATGIDAHVLDASLGMEGAVINPRTPSQLEDAQRVCRKHQSRMLEVEPVIL